MAQAAKKAPNKSASTKGTTRKAKMNAKGAAKKSARSSAKKKARKTAAKKTAAKKKRNKGGEPGTLLRIQDYLEEHLPGTERLDALKKAAARVEEAEPTQDLKRAAERFVEAYESLTERLGGIEESAEGRLAEARERLLDFAAVKAVQEGTERLSGRAVEELDEVLDRLGLMRKLVHDEELLLLKKRHKAARKAAETKARKAAERDLKKQAAA